MSLFGEDPDRLPTHSRVRSPLFDDGEGSTSLSVSRSSLFNDGPDSSHDLWGIPISRNSLHRGGVGHSNLETIQNIMKGADVPDVYADLYDELSSDTGNMIIEQLKSVFDRSGAPLSEYDNILNLVAGKERSNDTVVSRDAFCLFLALLALAEDGEEDLGFDAVDDRKRSWCSRAFFFSFLYIHNINSVEAQELRDI